MTLSNKIPPCSDAVISTSKLKKFKTQRIGLVTRNYGDELRGHRDFSRLFRDVLKTLDKEGCDTVVFSPYSIIKSSGYSSLKSIEKWNLEHIQIVLLELFEEESVKSDDPKKPKIQRSNGCNCLLYRTENGWQEERFPQHFGNLKVACKKKGEDKPMDRLLEDIPTKRMIGNCCILVCGETNGVKYSKSVPDKKVEDTFGLRESIPPEANIILNPVHDRMSRFEMPLKRKYLSGEDGNGRYVISLWNKGKEFGEQRKTRDGNKPPWMVCHNGKDVTHQVVKFDSNLPRALEALEIGIIQIPKA